MIWNPFKKNSGTEETPAKKEDSAKSESFETRIEREMDALPWFVKKQMKDPAVKQKFIETAKRMEADGVDLKNMKAVKKWVKEHEKEMKDQQGEPQKPVVKSAEERIGRNDPCPCGSGKKYKKCCGA